MHHFRDIQMPQSVTDRFRAMPTDPQEATWVCDTCGIVSPRSHVVDGITHYGRRQMCSCQEAAKKREEKDKLYREWVKAQSKHAYSWLGSQWSDLTLQGKTFENFKAEMQPEAYETARLYAADPSGVLALYGTFGTGKTHLLSAIANEALAKHGITSLFATAPDMFSAMQQRISQNGDYHDLVERASKIPLLVIDDVDKSKRSEFKEEIYFAIIDKRTKRELPTAISTNRLEDLADFVGGAVCSRLQIGQIAIPMNGKDYRELL